MFRKIDEWAGKEIYSCLSSDTKVDANTGSVLYETDTNITYEFNGTWNQTGASGASYVHIASSALTSEAEVMLAQDYDTFTIAAAGGTKDTWDVSGFDEIQFDAQWSAGADELSIFTSKDGVNFSNVTRLPWDFATRAKAAAALTADGEWLLEINCKKVRFSTPGATSAVTISWSAKTTGRARA